MQSFLRMKINQSASECVNLSTWLWFFCTELCRLICCIETAVIIFTGRMCIYLHVCLKKKKRWRKDELHKYEWRKASGPADTCTLVAQTCTSVASILAYCWGFFPTPTRFFICKSKKKKSSNKVFTSTLILCYVITVFASIQYLYTTAVGERGAAVALWCLWLFYRCSSFLPQF